MNKKSFAHINSDMPHFLRARFFHREKDKVPMKYLRRQKPDSFQILINSSFSKLPYLGALKKSNEMSFINEKALKISKKLPNNFKLFSTLSSKTVQFYNRCVYFF